MHSPFEQFKINLWVPLSFGDFDFSLTNINLLNMLIVGFLLLITFVIRKNLTFIPSFWQLFVEAVYGFVFSIVKEQAGKKGYQYFPHFFTVFFTILLFNLVGLIPFSFTVSSHVI